MCCLVYTETARRSFLTELNILLNCTRATVSASVSCYRLVYFIVLCPVFNKENDDDFTMGRRPRQEYFY